MQINHCIYSGSHDGLPDLELHHALQSYVGTIGTVVDVPLL